MIDKTFHHSTEDVCNSCKYRHCEQISTHRSVDICSLHGEETKPYWTCKQWRDNRDTR